MCITVAICTHNRARSLQGTLASLTEAWQQAPPGCDVLLVDNNSHDTTASVARQFQTALPITYVFEAAQGLSNARNRALREARGGLLIFTDDDVTVSPTWLREFLDGAAAFPAAEYFGGRILPRWQGKQPRWVRDVQMPLLGGLFVAYDLGEANQLYRGKDPPPYGASFAIRRSLFERLGPFRVDLGVCGRTPGRGEEAEYITRAQASGAVGAYIGRALSFHTVDPERLRLGYLYRYGVQKGIADIRMRPGGAPSGSVGNEVVFAIKGVAQLLRGRSDRMRQCVINMGIQRGLRTAARLDTLAQN
jgi:glycosyltransferase involved in cell wall biosynthesis